MRLFHVFVTVSLVAIVLAIWLPAREASLHSEGKVHVSEAVALLAELARAVEDYYQQYGRVPGVGDLRLKRTSGKFVEGLIGGNPYFAILRKNSVYPAVAGKTLGWSFNPATGQWDVCSLGTVELRFKPLRCREKNQ